MCVCAYACVCKRVCAFVNMFTCAWTHDFTPDISTRPAGDTHLLLPPHRRFPRRGCAGPDSLGDIFSLLSSRPPVPLDVFVREEEAETLYRPDTEEEQRTPPGGSRRRRRKRCRCLGRVVVGTPPLAYDTLGFWRFRSRHGLHLRAFSMWTHSQFWRGHHGGREYRDGEEQATDGWIHDWFLGRGWPAARPALRSWAVDGEPRLCFQPTCVPLEFRLLGFHARCSLMAFAFSLPPCAWCGKVSCRLIAPSASILSNLKTDARANLGVCRQGPDQDESVGGPGGGHIRDDGGRCACL